MAARMVHQLRNLCRNNVYVLKRCHDSSSSFLLQHRLFSFRSIAGLPSVQDNTQRDCLNCSTTWRGLQTDSSSQTQEPDKLHSPDHPLSNIEDPFKEPVEPCILCRNKVPLSYKNIQLLSQFISPNTGRLYGRHITKLCGYQQKNVAKAVKRARQMGFMPFMYRETIFLKDPNLFDIKYTGNIDLAMQESPSTTHTDKQEEADESSDVK